MPVITQDTGDNQNPEESQSLWQMTKITQARQQKTRNRSKDARETSKKKNE